MFPAKSDGHPSAEEAGRLGISSCNEDIVASARDDALLAQIQSAADVAAAFRDTRRRRTPQHGKIVRGNQVVDRDMPAAQNELEKIRMLVVGRLSWKGPE